MPRLSILNPILLLLLLPPLLFPETTLERQ